MNIGLIGAGAISRFLLDEINQKQLKAFRIQSVFVRDKEKYCSLEEAYGVQLYTDLNEFLNSEIDIVVEAADIEAVKNLIPTVIERKDVVLISVGALADTEVLTELLEVAEQRGNQLYLPSGAIGGLDLLQNANALGTVTYVSLTTRKPASSLIKEQIDEAQVVFEGKATDAIKQFPKNMNVSIVLALAGIGFDKTKVSLVADPHISQNIHEIQLLGDFGEATLTIKNNPLPANPKTSYLAAMSILGTLQRIHGRLLIGR
ncbi:aspartate dehydrogenase [Lysinibacillus sp. 2017]|uniref:aspartate dehydrogenase n=1 Tax=unclassified Lysinibacillus TaxID=2636778 RepID=UPI000D528A32|nr:MULTISPECIES: aspartate dehydrogenase [unclassified Lysinibacillus]AWE08566.1 aspartate dehydrogenase [Lysinibacillus sp. 2017]TGN35656.1 aspartate dehydrogenase [Lysinibacillus sp. S2017]